jgi:hypothetical protein
MKYWNEAIFDELRKFLKIYVRPLKFCIKNSFWNEMFEYWELEKFYDKFVDPISTHPNSCKFLWSLYSIDFPNQNLLKFFG